MTENDPYRPPSVLPPTEAERASFGELVKGWEKLRLVYNAILLLPGLGILALWMNKGLPLAAALLCALFVAICANVAFLLGPLAELYIRGFFRDGQSLAKGRWLIFSAGLVVSAGVFLLAALIAAL